MVIRRFGVWSVAKLYAVISACFGLIVGAIIAAVSAIGGGLAAASNEGSSPFPAAFLGVGAIILAPLFYGVMGLIAGSLGAVMYNLFAGVVGGVELETEP